MAVALATTAAVVLTGCAGDGAGPLGIGAIIGDRNLAAAEPLFSEDEERCLDSADQLLEILAVSDTEEKAGASDRNASRPERCKRIKQSFRNLLGPSPAAGSPNSDAQSQGDKAADVSGALGATQLSAGQRQASKEPGTSGSPYLGYSKGQRNE